VAASYEVVPADTNHYWAQLFQEAFIATHHEGDDLLFYVPLGWCCLLDISISFGEVERTSEPLLDIFRKHSTTRPIPTVHSWCRRAMLDNSF
jgi:hypothetical protein